MCGSQSKGLPLIEPNSRRVKGDHVDLITERGQTKDHNKRGASHQEQLTIISSDKEVKLQKRDLREHHNNYHNAV